MIVVKSFISSLSSNVTHDRHLCAVGLNWVNLHRWPAFLPTKSKKLHCFFFLNIQRFTECSFFWGFFCNVFGVGDREITFVSNCHCV